MSNDTGQPFNRAVRGSVWLCGVLCVVLCVVCAWSVRERKKTDYLSHTQKHLKSPQVCKGYAVLIHKKIRILLIF